MKFLVLIPSLFIFVMFGTANANPPEIASDIEKRLAQLPKTFIDYDRTLLDENDKQIVNKLVESSKLIEELYWTQVSSDNMELRDQLVQAAQGSKSYQLALEFFNVMKGRWDRITQNEPFIAPFGMTGQKPAGAGFYPKDMTIGEFNTWIKEHPEDKDAFQNVTTIITRSANGLIAIPYSEYYKKYLLPAAEKLREAAALTKNRSLHDFLIQRADSFLTNDYFQSEMAWMDLDSSIDLVIGPYEVYEDGLFNFKASFEAFVTVVDKIESEKLKIYGEYLRDMELNLPEPDEYKNFDRGSESPIRVVQQIFAAGDARRGVTTAAFNLPNDEKVREAKGSKKVLLKNVMEAKFYKTGEPVAERVLGSTQQISFDAFYNHVLFHELSHGLGPGVIIGPDGQKAESRIYLKDLYSSIEECKADVLGVWNLLYVMDKQLLTSFDKNTLYSTYVGLLFRSMRLGIKEAHGRGNAVQWTWLREQGAIIKNSNGMYQADPEKMYEGIKSLANELLLIEATGDYARAQSLLNQYGNSTDEIDTILQKLSDIPIDISPIFIGAGE